MNGIYSHAELIDGILTDLNSLMKFHMIGEHVMACAIMTGISQKLMKLKEGVANDLKNRENTIEQLKEELRACGREVIDIPANEFGKDQK
ncbi:MAG: hypothetical protein II008_21275 [Oscillospiraceae bacterium]|nr:hypothetical protein [Oscillospiraceae bacterium]